MPRLPKLALNSTRESDTLGGADASRIDHVD